MTVRRLVLLAAMAAALGPSLACSRAEAQSEPPSASALLRRIGTACKADTARFCPALLQTGITPRDQFICLKSYKANLAFGCRGAINAYAAR